MTQFIRDTGHDPRVVKDMPGLFRYINYMLGFDPFVGNQRRSLQTRLGEEMKAQGWTLDDMAKTVRYVKRYKKKVTAPWGITFYVWEAKRWEEEVDTYDLQTKVALAMSSETDEVWLRRLALAKGKALQAVYQRWEEERG